MTKPGAPVPGLHRRVPWVKSDTASAVRLPAPVPEASLCVQAFASRDQLSRLLPQGCAHDHSIEVQDGGLRIRGPRAPDIAAQIDHAVNLLNLLGTRGSQAIDVLLDLPGDGDRVTPWLALSIRESPDWGRLQGDPADCLVLLDRLLAAQRLLLACHLFVRLTPALQLGVLQGLPAFDQLFGQRLAAELGSTQQLLQLRQTTAQWCQLELQRLDCQGLQESMDGAFRELCRSAMAQGDAPALALLLGACPSGTLAALLRALGSWSGLAASCAADPGLAAALADARSRLASAGPRPLPGA